MLASYYVRTFDFSTLPAYDADALYHQRNRTSHKNDVVIAYTYDDIFLCNQDLDIRSYHLRFSLII